MVLLKKNDSKHFSLVTSVYRDLQYMREEQADFMRRFIVDHEIRDVLEVGFYKGKSSAYIAAVLEDLDLGHLVTLDRHPAKKYSPNIHEVLDRLQLSHRVTPIFAHRSHTWELGKMVREEPRPQFDLCYFDGGHTWDVTGFGFVLVDMLLRPGGWIIFDDLNWTIAGSVGRGGSDTYTQYSEDERAAQGVRLVYETLAPRLGYTDMKEVKEFQWGVARKPL